MGRCCGRSSAGCWVPASVLLGRKRVLGNPASFWTAACAAVPRGRCKEGLDSCLRTNDTGAVQRSLDSCLRRNDTCWVPACAGMTLWPPHPAVPWAPPASPAVGRGVLDCCLRRKDTVWVPAYAGRTPRGTPKEAWVPACAGMTPAGFLLAQESHCGPLTRRCLGHRRPLPRWGEAGWTAACAGMTLCGFLLMREGDQGAHPKKPGPLLSQE